ncbi:MAG: hypothetical protein WCY10_00700, partial [Candidatus Omnitrophota bacterium]
EWVKQPAANFASFKTLSGILEQTGCPKESIPGLVDLAFNVYKSDVDIPFGEPAAMVKKIAEEFKLNEKRDGGEEEDYIRRLVPRFGCDEVLSVRRIKGFFPVSFDDLQTYVVDVAYGSKILTLVLKEANTYSYECYASMVLEAFALPTPVMISYRSPYYIYTFVGNIDLEDLYSTRRGLLRDFVFVQRFAYLLGRSAFAAYLIGLGDRNGSNIRVALDRNFAQEVYNIDFVSVFTASDPAELTAQKGVLNTMLHNLPAGEMRVTAKENFINGFVYTMEDIQTGVVTGDLPISKKLLGCRFGNYALNNLKADARGLARKLDGGQLGQELKGVRQHAGSYVGPRGFSGQNDADPSVDEKNEGYALPLLCEVGLERLNTESVFQAARSLDAVLSCV